MLCTNNSGSKCEITYEIAGYLLGKDRKEASRRINISALRNDSGAMMGRVVCPPDTQTVNICCCINKGTMTLGANADRGVVSGGECINVDYSYRNESTVPILGVHVALTQEMNWSANGHSANVHHILAKKDLHVDSEGQGSLQSIQLCVDPGAKETYDGRKIKVRHYLKVVLNTKCCVTNPEVCTIICVQPPRSTKISTNPASNPITTDQEIEIQIPPNWNPQTEPCIEIPIANVVLSGEETFYSTSLHDEAPEYKSPVYQSLNSHEILPSAPIESVHPLDKIKRDMDYTFDHKGLVDNLTTDTTYKATFEKLPPIQYADILSRVRSVFDQPYCARRIAEIIDNFSCAHVAAACERLSTIYRANIVKEIAPLARDLAKNKNVIEEKLGSFEKLQCKDALSIGNF